MEGQPVNENDVLAHGYKRGRAEDIDMAKEKKLPEAQRLLPLFIFDDNGEKYYIVTVRGSGLWDEIWGNIAVEDDFTTIAGVAFDHKAETPGLGAEIKDNPAFPRQFQGKKIYKEDGTYTSVVVRKGGAVHDRYEVDGISGATITGNGVAEMLYRGIRYYEPYFESLKAK
jgi:Na+-transporting NADH:ubiquinone oxidoreductase subunit C